MVKIIPKWYRCIIGLTTLIMITTLIKLGNPVIKPLYRSLEPQPEVYRNTVCHIWLVPSTIKWLVFRVPFDTM